MQIQVNTDHNIEGNEALSEHVKSVVEGAFGHLGDHITRVEVHLNDENSDKKGGDNDMRCMIETRLQGRQPIAVTHHAETLHQAIDGAVEKSHRTIKNTIKRQRDHRVKEDLTFEDE